jgi:DNA-binding CsgD family transcriptional regulator/MFS family permease
MDLSSSFSFGLNSFGLNIDSLAGTEIAPEIAPVGTNLVLVPSLLLSLWFSALTYFIFGKYFDRLNKVIIHRWYLGAIAFFMCLGGLLLLLWIYGGRNGVGVVEISDNKIGGGIGGDVNDVAAVSYVVGAGADSRMILYFFGSLCVGCSTACMLLEWGRIFGYLGSQTVLFHGIAAMFGSALLVFLLSFAPVLVARIVFVCVPLPLVVCLKIALRDIPLRRVARVWQENKQEAKRETKQETKQEIKQETKQETKRYTPHRFLVTATLHGLALGILAGFMLLSLNNSEPVTLSALSYVAAAIFLLATAVWIRLDFNHLIYRIGFPLMALGALLVSFGGVFWFWGVSIQLIGFCYVHLIMWGLCSYITKHFGLSPVWVVAWPTCALMLGQFVGTVIGAIVSQGSDASYWVAVAAGITAFVLLLASLLMLSEQNIRTGWGIARPGNSSSTGNALTEAVMQVASDFELTQRECEVMSLLARGRNRKIICEELVISDATAKSHIRNIYRKMGVHAHQELIDVVLCTQQSLNETKSGALECASECASECVSEGALEDASEQIAIK